MGAGNLLGIGASMLGMATQDNRQSQQYQRQRNLMGLQNRYQQQLNQQGANLQYDMWKKTSYPAQMEMLKEAGLNPALIYGQGGGGGTTTGSQTGGSASGGQASAPMDIGGAVQMGMMASQIKLQEAQAEKTQSEAENIKMDNQTKKNFGQSADMYEASNRMSEALARGQFMYESEKGDTSDGGKRYRMWELMQAELSKAKLGAKELEEEVKNIKMSNEIKEETKEDAINFMKHKALNEAIDLEVKKEGIQLSKEQRNKMWHEIRQQWVNAGMRGLDVITKGWIAKNLGQQPKLKSSQTDYNNGNTTYKNYK